MALTQQNIIGNKKFIQFYLTGGIKGAFIQLLLDNSYPTGGYTVPAGFFALKRILGVQIIGINAAGSGIVSLEWDFTNGKLLAFQSNLAAHSHPLTLKNAAVADGATTRVNAGTNLLGANTGSDITVAGGGANGGVQNSTAANQNLVQVANATDLSAVSCRLMGFGRTI